MRMHCTLALSGAALLASVASVASPAAHAGGIGLMTTGGYRAAPAYYYRDDGVQGIDWQNRPTMGIGAEALLGDRDNRILGVARLYALIESPVNEPDLSNEDTSTYTFTYPAAHEQPARTVGTVMVGVQWGLWGDPTGFQVVATTLAGSGFLTSDSAEFLILEPGAGVTYTMGERVQVFGTANYQVRFRKTFNQGANAYAGIRYLFD